MYFGGFYNTTPTNYIQLSNGAININVTGNVSITATGTATIQAAIIKLQNLGTNLKALVNDAWFSFFDSHVHSSGGAGVPTTLSTPTKSTMETSVTKAE